MPLQRRRLRLVSTAVDSDTKSISSGGASRRSGVSEAVTPLPESDEDVAPNLLAPPTPNVAVHDGLASLDNVNLQVELEKRAVVMRSVPHILPGPHRAAMRIALQTFFAF